MSQRILRPATAFQSSGTRTKNPRVKNKEHLAFVSKLPCVVTGRRDAVDVAHIRMGNIRLAKRETGGSEKASDIWVVPLCREEHEKQHKMAEQEYWDGVKIDPFSVALALYGCSGDEERGEQIIRNARRGNV